MEGCYRLRIWDEECGLTFQPDFVVEHGPPSLFPPLTLKIEVIADFWVVIGLRNRQSIPRGSGSPYLDKKRRPTLYESALAHTSIPLEEV